MMRYVGTRRNGRPLYEDRAGRLVGWATPSGHAPSERRFVFTVERGGTTRCRFAGTELKGEELLRVNVPRSVRYPAARARVLMDLLVAEEVN